ncbi:M17 family peptidase N-terminal domain-containing protein [Novosphingobium terrae]|uniref:M17 family peptidase N-terminal domain-containing protein n=1 Tax=Novosphingobium terrae TaxID=2726189 RepID=UPI001981A376|nr:M17 family peptidase N-terminal domain-containing protein [Novosphingobium terrae]
MTFESPDKGRQVIELGTHRDCHFDLVAGDLTTIEADVAVAALCAQPHLRHLAPGIDALDRALRGAIARLRAEGIFTGSWSEILYLSSLPSTIKVKGVILLGLGPTGRNSRVKVRRAFMIAASQAIRLGADHAAFAPAQLNTGLPRYNAEASAYAVLQGISDAVGRMRGGLRRCSFVAPEQELEAVAEKFALAFRRVVEH